MDKREAEEVRVYGVMIAVFEMAFEKQSRRDALRAGHQLIWERYMRWEREDVFEKLSECENEAAFDERLTDVLNRGADVRERFVDWAVENGLLPDEEKDPFLA